MNWIVVLCCAPSFVFLFILTSLSFLPDPQTDKKVPQKDVFILIAARNEELLLPQCLKALMRLNYPHHLIHVCIGNDQSEDGTKEVAEAFSHDFQSLRVLDIPSNGPSGAKARVLAQLASEVTTDFFFITDADVEVPPTWVQEMLSQVQETTGMVTGTTAVRSGGFFGRMQNIDWLYTLGIVKTLGRVGYQVTAMGNNMLVRTEAYRAVGGYEAMPFSITEDFALLQAIKKTSWKSKMCYAPGVLAQTQPSETLISLLHQRKRWMRGALTLHWSIVLILGLNALFVLGALSAFLLHPFLGFSVVGGRFLVGAVYYARDAYLLKIGRHWPWILLYDLYYYPFTLLLLIWYFLPFRVRWKGRLY